MYKSYKSCTSIVQAQHKYWGGKARGRRWKSAISEPMLHRDLTDTAQRCIRKHEALISEARGAYFGSARRLFRKRRALISEAQGAYLGSAGSLFRKHGELSSEARGAYLGSAGSLSRKRRALISEARGPLPGRAGGFVIRQQGI